MDLAEVYVALGRNRCNRLVRTIAIGALKTYGVYEGIKIRSRLRRFNRQKLRAAAPRLWQRVTEGDNELARELAQAVLVSNIPLVVGVLDLLEIEHDGIGFFAKDDDYTEQLSDGWEARVYERFSGQFPDDLVLLYINHLGWETGTLDEPFTGADGNGLSERSA